VFGRALQDGQICRAPWHPLESRPRTPHGRGSGEENISVGAVCHSPDKVDTQHSKSSSTHALDMAWAPDRIHMDLFGMQNRTLNPYLATINAAPTPCPRTCTRTMRSRQRRHGGEDGLGQTRGLRMLRCAVLHADDPRQRRGRGRGAPGYGQRRVGLRRSGRLLLSHQGGPRPCLARRAQLRVDAQHVTKAVCTSNLKGVLSRPAGLLQCPAHRSLSPSGSV
jgi:hypothetical protein